MKKLLKVLSFLSLFFVLILESFAIDAPTDLKLDYSNWSTINLSWNVAPEAYMNYIVYSEQSWLEIGYNMSTSYSEETTAEISDLEVGKTYYFAAISVDENAEESWYSNELLVNIPDPNDLSGSQIDFALDYIKLLEYNKIELEFNSELDDSVDALREFKIVNTKDDLDSFEVISADINPNDSTKIQVTLDRNTEIWNEYEVVIIAITSALWKNIESWIDNTETFFVTEIVAEEEVLVIEEVVIEEEVEEEFIVLDDLINDEVQPEDNLELNTAEDSHMWNAWANVEAWTIENTTLWLADSNTKLPKTWAEHILMLILATILWALIFVFKYKKD